MSQTIAEKIIDFAYRNTPNDKKIDIGFFGGEPLLEFELIQEITKYIKDHPLYEADRIQLSLVSNGTIFTREIANFIEKHIFSFCISCDGPYQVQDLFRCFPGGQGSSHLVEKNIKQAVQLLPNVLVNAVYHPQTFHFLPEVIQYFSSLGLRQIYLNPDFSASWTKEDIDSLPEVYGQIGELYCKFCLNKDPHFVSLIDSKIAVILRGGYQPSERCQMGVRDLAFSPQGNIYLCERLVGSGDNNEHCIGNIRNGFQVKNIFCNKEFIECSNDECQKCTLRDYCMNWCGCSNFFSTGYYSKVNSFLCASERAAIQIGFNTFQKLEEKIGPVFFEHFSGRPQSISRYKI